MLAAGQLGLFRSSDRAPENVQAGVRPPTVGTLGKGVALRVDTAFATAQRYVLEVNSGRTALVPTTAGAATDSPASASPANASRPGTSASWVEHVPNWLTPHAPLFEALLSDCSWQSQQRLMYDRVVDVPRLLARPTPGLRSTTLLDAFGKRLSERYGRSLVTSTVALYRDGRDSVAPHGDKLGAAVNDSVVVVLSLGHTRLMRLRPVTSQRGLRSIDFDLGGGDLFVMGGRCQADWLHSIPKTLGARSRISVMFREVART